MGGGVSETIRHNSRMIVSGANSSDISLLQRCVFKAVKHSPHHSPSGWHRMEKKQASLFDPKLPHAVMETMVFIIFLKFTHSDVTQHSCLKNTCSLATL